MRSTKQEPNGNVKANKAVSMPFPSWSDHLGKGNARSLSWLPLK